ncbi:MAG: DUF624 domain-containing protein [Ruminococcus sp.]|uniref:DUF624 domain-containing protein n=1 Tax=Ruminococcus sp. TaxID=41978 RepID=UPI0028734033|nr:DUF624 domain-containing protein [Ruminococcus sp.]MBQ3284100.1 DUF624 domain-containing protein [Ruminococcus sp.]
MENERKKFRFEILLERYFTNFHRILFTNLIFAVPSAVIFALFYFLNSFIFKDSLVVPFLLLSIIPLYPFYAGVVMVCRNIARGERDVPVFRSFIRAVKDNFPHFLLHGVLIYVASMLCVLAVSLYVSMLSVSWVFYGLLFVVIVIALFVLYTAFYIPLMSITYDLPLKYVYKNSFLMSFGEFKNNLFATLALAVVFGICFTAVAFINSGMAKIIVVAALWVLLIPATCTFMYVFFVYDGMTAIIRDKDELSRELTDSIDKSLEQRKKEMNPQTVEEDFSDIDISSLKDTDDYIFHNGRMVKQSTLLRMIREREQQNAESGSDSDE